MTAVGPNEGQAIMIVPGIPTTPTPTAEDMVRELWDRQQISDVMLRFGRGLDTRDWELYAATLTDPFEVDFSDLTGDSP